jgi:hypothetical protein
MAKFTTQPIIITSFMQTPIPNCQFENIFPPHLSIEIS